MANPTPRLHYGWIVLLMGVLVVFASLGLARFGYSMVLPAMQVGLGMDNTAGGVLATANLIGYLLLSALGGALASHFGPRRVIAVGLAIAAVGMVLTGLSHSTADAALWRGVTGIGSGASNVPVMGLVAGWFALRRRGLATGLTASGSSVALIVLGATVPAILSAYAEEGWRACWFVFGGATLLLALTAYAILRNRPADVGLRPVGAQQQTAPSAAPGPPGLLVSRPLGWADVYRSRAVWALGLVYVAFGFSYIIYMTFFVKALMAEGGYSQQAAGSLFMTMGWCSLLCGVIWGAVSDAIGRKWALVIVYLIQATSYALFGLVPTVAGFTLSAVLFGLTAWSIPAIMAAACGDMLGPRLAPAALGFITLFFGVGQAAGPAVHGIIADATGSHLPGMLLAAAVAALGALGGSLLRPVVASAEEP